MRNRVFRFFFFLFIYPGYIDGLADAVEQGLVKAVGVSNYSGIIKFLSKLDEGNREKIKFYSQ